MVLKIQSYWGKSISFNELTKVELTDNSLIIYKYKNELHSNEVAILPYYISNLNIEFTYNQKMGQYTEFKNHCFVDTLDNMGFEFRGKQFDIFDSFSEENSS